MIVNLAQTGRMVVVEGDALGCPSCHALQRTLADAHTREAQSWGVRGAELLSVKRGDRAICEWNQLGTFADFNEG